MASAQVVETSVTNNNPISQMIFFNQGMLLLGSDHFLMMLQFDYVFWRQGNGKKNTYSIVVTTLFPGEERASVELLWFLKLIDF